MPEFLSYNMLIIFKIYFRLHTRLISRCRAGQHLPPARHKFP